MIIKKNLFSIIILNYNGASFLKDCLDSIISETKQNFEIIVVDNNSPDKSGEKFKKKYPSCKFILNENNVGVSEGLNIGIKNSCGEFVILLNNDLKVAQNWLDSLFDAYKINGIGLYQPKFLKMSNNKIIDSSGNFVNIFGFGFSREKGNKDIGQFKNVEEIGFAAGTCLFCPREIFERVGYFDKKLFAYNEDLDLGWRANLIGFKSFYVPKSIVYHHGSAQWKWGGEKFYLLERNRWIILLSNYNFKTILRLLPSLIIIEIALLVFFAKKKLLLKKLRSYGGIIRMSNHIKKRQSSIKNLRTLSDEQIIRSFCCTIETPLEVSDSKNINQFNKLLKFLCRLSGFYHKTRLM